MSIYSKKDVVTELILTAPVRILVDTKVDGVVLPEPYDQEVSLALLIGHGLPVPIRDLDLGDEGIGATLSFNRKGEWCFIPWPAIVGLHQEEQVRIMWGDDIPVQEPEPKRPALSVVKS